MVLLHSEKNPPYNVNVYIPPITILYEAFCVIFFTLTTKFIFPLFTENYFMPFVKYIFSFSAFKSLLIVVLFVVFVVAWDDKIIIHYCKAVVQGGFCYSYSAVQWVRFLMDLIQI